MLPNQSLANERHVRNIAMCTVRPRTCTWVHVCVKGRAGCASGWECVCVCGCGCVCVGARGCVCIGLYSTVLYCTVLYSTVGVFVLALELALVHVCVCVCVGVCAPRPLLTT
jgi:hypothetical protein